MCLHQHLNHNCQYQSKNRHTLCVCISYSISIHCVCRAIVGGVLSFTTIFLSFRIKLANISFSEVKKVKTLWFSLVLMVFSHIFRGFTLFSNPCFVCFFASLNCLPVLCHDDYLTCLGIKKVNYSVFHEPFHSV